MSLSALLLLMAAIGCVMSRDGCGPLQRIKVMMEAGACEKRFFAAERQHTDLPGIEDGRAIHFLKLFTEAPETKALFGYVDGVALTKLRAQGSRFVHTMKNLIGILDMDGVLQESLAHLRAQHGVRHLKPEYYTLVAQQYLRTASYCVPWPLDDQAWTSCTKLIIEGISGVPIDV